MRARRRTSTRANRPWPPKEVHVSSPSPDASVFARPTQPPSVTRATLASGAPAHPGRYGHSGAGPNRQRLAGPCCRRAIVARCAEHQCDRARLGHIAATATKSLDEVGRRKALRVHDGLRPPDRLTRRVRVAAAHRGYPPVLPQQLLPDPQRQLVIDVPQPVPDFHRVHVVVAELPCASRKRHRRMRGHHETAVRPQPLGVGGEDAVARRVPPVNPAARRQRDRQPMPVTGGDLLTRDDLQAVVLGCRPGPVGGAGVVVGGDDEVKAGRRGGRGRSDPPGSRASR